MHMDISHWPLQEIYPNKENKIQSVINEDYSIFDDFGNIDYEQATCLTRHIPLTFNIGPEEKEFKDAFALYTNIQSFPTSTTLDALLSEPFLLAGCLTLLHGPDKPSRAYIIQLFISLMLKYYTQGVVFIDCTNVFPAYELIEAAIGKYPLIDPQLPIRAIQLSRSFNYHQATETIKENLEPLLRDGFNYNVTNALAEIQQTNFVKPKIVIVAGLPDLYLNQESAQYLSYDDRPPWWSIFELQEAIGHLRSLTLKYNCITLISASTAPKSKTKSLGGKYLNQSAAIIIKLATEGMAIYGELVKHPFAKNREILLQILKKKGKKRATLPLKLFF